MKTLFYAGVALCLPTILALAVLAGEAEKTYTLRYKFKPGETIRWKVEHRSKVRATITRSTQTTETLSISMKVWQISAVKPDGTATFENSVEWVDMRQTLTGRSEVHYDSRTGKKPPPGFETAAKSVGVPLARVTMDAHGKVISRKDLKPKPKDAADKKTPEHEGWVTIPLPEKPVPVGHTWRIPQDIDIPLPSGAVKRIKALQQFTLEEVKTGVAVIRVSTDVLTPISDPAIESQLVQRESTGRVWFNVDAGRVLHQQLDIDKHVVGFRGDASSIHYVNRFTERLVTDSDRVAGKHAERE